MEQNIKTYMLKLLKNLVRYCRIFNVLTFGMRKQCIRVRFWIYERENARFRSLLRTGNTMPSECEQAQRF